jgi:hypothetical protein
MGLLHFLVKVLKNVTNENKEVPYTFCYNIVLRLENKGRDSKINIVFHFSSVESGADLGFVAPEAYTIFGVIFYEKI